GVDGDDLPVADRPQLDQAALHRPAVLDDLARDRVEPGEILPAAAGGRRQQQPHRGPPTPHAKASAVGERGWRTTPHGCGYQSLPGVPPSRGSLTAAQVAGLMATGTNRTLPSPRQTFSPPR